MKYQVSYMYDYLEMKDKEVTSRSASIVPI